MTLRFFQSFLLSLGLCLLLGCSFLGQPVKRPLRTPQRSPSFGVSPTSASLSSPYFPRTSAENGGNEGSLATPTPLISPIFGVQNGGTQEGPSSTFTASPTVTLTPTITLTRRFTRTPTHTPTITLTPTLDPNNVLLRIAAPGPMSKVVSPIDFVVYVAPDFVGRTRIELIGEDGRPLYTKAFRTYSNIGSSTRVAQQIDFEIHGAAEVARLQISTLDQYGQMQAFNSVRLLLLSVGENQLSPAYAPVERVLLRTPKMDDEISGGLLNIEGEMQPVNDLPVVLELYDMDGKLLGSRILTFQHNDGAYQLFSATIPYQVDKKIPSRLVIRQDDDRIDGLAYLYSVEILVGR